MEDRPRGQPSRFDLLNRSIVACERCPRLRDHCRLIAQEKRRAFAEYEYWGKPVPNFGDAAARLLIIGLAPAAHGANRTGRMFTGDRSGQWLYRALHKAGFANQAISEQAADGLRLLDCAITAVCHCAPPDNKPTNEEIVQCRLWLRETIDLVPAKVLLALGQIAWRGVVDEALSRGWWSGARPNFGHGACVPLTDGRWLLGSYHPSQQNTFTGKLTQPMFDRVFRKAQRLLLADAGRRKSRRGVRMQRG
jgi:uracil-DNA glycosylase family 4